MKFGEDRSLIVTFRAGTDKQAHKQTNRQMQRTNQLAEFRLATIQLATKRRVERWYDLSQNGIIYHTG